MIKVEQAESYLKSKIGGHSSDIARIYVANEGEAACIPCVSRKNIAFMK